MNRTLQFTRLSNQHGALAKEYSLAEDGSLKRKTHGRLAEGVAETVRCPDLASFAEHLQSCRPEQAFAYGVCGRERAEIVPKDELHKHRDKIARDREHFHYPKGPGVLMLDHDAGHLPQPYERDELRDTLLRACPGLEFAPMAWVPSGSSFIYRQDNGAELQGLRGQRLYVPVADASDIPRAGRALYERLWASGVGEFAVSASGALLDRNLIDAATWRPEGLDFAAGAVCKAPLVQRRPPPFVWEADLVGGLDPIDTVQAVPALTTAELEAASQAKAAARARAEPQRLEVRHAYIEQQAQELVQHGGVSLERAREVVARSTDDQLLFAEFLLWPDGADKPVTVGQVLDNPERWHGRRFADPVEVQYRGDRRIAWANLLGGGRPSLYSHAHGGRRFDLVRQPRTLRVEPGEMPALADKSLAVARVLGDLYDFGPQQMARVADGQIRTVTQGYLLDYLGRVIRFEKYDGRSKSYVPTNTPELLARAIMERSGERGLPQLRAVVTAPTLRADGSVLDQPGYDKASGLLLTSDRPEILRVSPTPSLAQVQAALRELYEPLSGFPFDGPVSRGVMIAALLSSVCRRSLSTCPAFAFDAPAAGTGKTLAARCVAVLGGHSGASFSPPGNEEELRKMLFAELLAGSGCIILDNQTGPFGGAVVNQALTEPQFAGRVLGASITSTVPNTALLLVTANNFRPYADTCRRVLVCRLDAGVEQPYKRQFDFDPVDWIRDRRQRLVVAALTLLRGYLTSGASAGSVAALGSFEQWDALVRRTVCWLAGVQTEIPLDDPALSVDTSAVQDESRNTLAAMLVAWEQMFGRTPVTAARAMAAASGVLGDEFGAGPDADARRAALQEAIDRVADEGKGRFNAVNLGKWLGKHKDQIAGGRKFSRLDDRNDVSRWRVDGSAAGVRGG